MAYQPLNVQQPTQTAQGGMPTVQGLNPVATQTPLVQPPKSESGEDGSAIEQGAKMASSGQATAAQAGGGSDSMGGGSSSGSMG